MNTWLSSRGARPIGRGMSDRALGSLLSRRTGRHGGYMVTGPGLTAEYTLAYKNTDIATFSPVTGRVTIWARYTDLLPVYNKLLKRFGIRAGARGNELYVKRSKGLPVIPEVQGTAISIDLRGTCGRLAPPPWPMACYKEDI